MSDQNPTPDDEDWDFATARARLAPTTDNSKKARQARQRKLSSAVDRAAKDGRSLRATGRTEHLNFKSRPEIKAALDEHVGKGRLSLWLEEAIIAKFKSEGFEIDDA
jgi:hypothetical protein